MNLAALVLSLPTRNSTLRMRLWRALKDSGCGVLRDGVYVLPADRAAVLAGIEDEIRAQGGFGMTFELKARSEPQGAEIRKLFDRSADYGELVKRLEAARKSIAARGARRAQTEIRRLERALE